MKTEELQKELEGFTGTEKYHKLTLTKLVATDGVAHMAQIAKAFWLIDAIGSYGGDPRIAYLDIQFWHLVVKDQKAMLYIQEDKDTPKLITQKIGYTDFPEGDWIFYVANNVMMLPSEY